MKNFRISTLRDRNKSINKIIYIDENDQLKKAPQATVSKGICDTKEFNWNTFTSYISDIPDNECLMLGVNKYDEPTIKISCDGEPESYGRTLDNFRWSDEYQLLYFDFDEAGGREFTYLEFIDAITTVIPSFKDTTKIVKFSSSAHIYDNEDNLLSKSNGFHIYFLIKHPDLIQEVFAGNTSIIHKRLWINGYGHIKNTNPLDPSKTVVNQLDRTIIDGSVFSPERIVFETQPTISNGLNKKFTKAVLMEGENEYIDLSDIKPITDKEEEVFQSILQQAKEENEQTPYMIACKEKFENRIKSKISREWIKNEHPEYIGLQDWEIIKLEREKSQQRVLSMDTMIFLKGGQCIEVQDIVENPYVYDKMKCKDVDEPDYAGPIAIIYGNMDSGNPVIYSHAHGGITYKLPRLKNKETEKPMRYDEDKQEEQDILDTATPVEKDYNAWMSDVDNWLDTVYIVNNVEKGSNGYFRVNGNDITGYTKTHLQNIGSYNFEYEDASGNTKTTSVYNAWNKNPKRKIIESEIFKPGESILFKDRGRTHINTYLPTYVKEDTFEMTDEEVDIAARPFVNHVMDLIHNEREANILLDWFAYLLQKPNKRPKFCPLITSETHGVGKNITTDIFGSVLGISYTSTINDLGKIVKPDSWGDVINKKKLVVVSECGRSDDRYTISDSLKSLITDDKMTLNLKGSSIQEKRVYFGLIMFSNEMNPFQLEQNDRRFFVTTCDWDKEKVNRLIDNDYYKNLVEFYSDDNLKNIIGLSKWFMKREISRTSMVDTQAPETKVKDILLASSMSDLDQFRYDLQQHPLKFWTKTWLKDLFKMTMVGMDGSDDADLDKKFLSIWRSMMSTSKNRVKIDGETYNFKCFDRKCAESTNTEIRDNVLNYKDKRMSLDCDMNEQSFIGDTNKWVRHTTQTIN